MPQSKEANYAYACKKLSMFGGCLENVKKEVCKISDNCNQSLENMEKSYTENDFFGATKNDFLEHLNEKRKIDIIEGASIDIISEWNNSSGLGDLKKQDLDNKFEELIKEAKYLKSNSPSEFLYAMKRKIKASKKKLTANFKKSEIHSKVIDYFHNNLNSFFETLVNSEKLQSFSFSQCGLNEKVSKEFCSNYIKWNQDYSVFEELEEVNNLAADECPRVVLRIDVKESFTTAKDGSCKHNGSYTNGIENFKALEKSTSKIIKKME